MLTLADIGRTDRLRPTQAASLAQYVACLEARGVRVCPGADGTYWIASADRIVRRLPTFHIGTPDPAEVDQVLRQTGSVVASYLAEPATDQSGNAWLYLCADSGYSMRTLGAPVQRNVRRGLRELAIAPLTRAELLAHGAQAFCDTRNRNGLDDGDPEGFRKYFESRVDDRGRSYLGAWKDGQLAAFVHVLHIEDWIELGSFSSNAMLPYRPNDALMYTTLATYLSEHRCRIVSYGLSSIQAVSNAAGLHRFKLKLGFQAIRVHRAFILHPILRVVTNDLTLTAAHWTVNGVLRLRPRNRRLKKLGGMLGSMLGVPSMAQMLDV
jgi:hypothetical protein